MNILFISRCPPYPLHLGDRLIVYHLARTLAARGHTLDLLAFDDLPHHDSTAYRAFFRHLHILPAPKRTPLDLVARLISRFPSHPARAWSPDMWGLIEKMRVENRYDVAQLFGGIQVYEVAGALGGLPTIITPYESYSLYLQRRLSGRDPFVYAQYRIARAYESFMFAPYQRTVVVAEPDRAMLRAINPALHINVIPNGIDFGYFQAHDVRREPCTLLFTGNYEYAPNVEAALRLARDIFLVVLAHFPEARLQLVGNAPPPELLAVKSSLINVTGRVPDVRPYLATATIFVSPLTTGAGIKNKILEALAMSCPVVATPLSMDGIAAVDGEHALIAPVKHIADAVIRLLHDADLQAKLSSDGRALIEGRYRWEQVAAAYEQVYLDVLESSRK